MPDADQRICILLPVLNEEANIERLLAGIEEALLGRAYSVCIVDDGSRDRTRDLITRAAEANPGRYHLIFREKRTRGSVRGSALHQSLLWAVNDPRHQVFVEMDGDLSHRPEELLRGIEAVESASADVVIASKYLPESRVTNRPVSRRLVSWCCNLAVRALLSRRIRDYSNGFRFYNRAAAEAIVATRIRYGSPIYLSEVMAIWLHAGLRFRELPTTYIGRNEGVSKLRKRDLGKAGLAIFEIAWRLHVAGFQRSDPALGTASAREAAPERAAED